MSVAPLVFLLLIVVLFLACPLSMLLMRGRHGGHGSGGRCGHVIDRRADDARLAELDREVARLREAQRRDDAVEARR